MCRYTVVHLVFWREIFSGRDFVKFCSWRRESANLSEIQKILEKEKKFLKMAPRSFWTWRYDFRLELGTWPKYLWKSGGTYPRNLKRSRENPQSLEILRFYKTDCNFIGTFRDISVQNSKGLETWIWENPVMIQVIKNSKVTNPLRKIQDFLWHFRWVHESSLMIHTNLKNESVPCCMTAILYCRQITNSHEWYDISFLATNISIDEHFISYFMFLDRRFILFI